MSLGVAGTGWGYLYRAYVVTRKKENRAQANPVGYGTVRVEKQGLALLALLAFLAFLAFLALLSLLHPPDVLQ